MKRFGMCAVVGVAVILGAGCGGDGGGDDVATLGGGDGGGAETTTTLPADEAMLKFVRCMREHGIDMPDPDENGSVISRVGEGGFDPQSEEFRAANEACEEYAPSMDGVSEEDAAQLQDQMREMAECMRDAGFDIPDPVIVAPGEDPPPAPSQEPDFDPDDPAFREAERRCSARVGLEAPDGVGREGFERP